MNKHTYFQLQYERVNAGWYRLMYSCYLHLTNILLEWFISSVSHHHVCHLKAHLHDRIFLTICRARQQLTPPPQEGNTDTVTLPHYPSSWYNCQIMTICFFYVFLPNSILSPSCAVFLTSLSVWEILLIIEMLGLVTLTHKTCKKHKNLLEHLKYLLKFPQSMETNLKYTSRSLIYFYHNSFTYTFSWFPDFFKLPVTLEFYELQGILKINFIQ